jgi:hypothetical protein
MGAPAADGQTLRELCACAAAAACALSLTLGCSHSRGNRDANADQGSRSEDDVHAIYGKDDGFDVFWMGSLDGATWGNYLTQVRCAEP